MTCRHLVEHTTQSEDVGSGIGLQAVELLGSHVLKRAEDCAFLREWLGLGREVRQALDR